ncbi:quinone oxidoreductase PIG3-like [Impatiens glandulifera]|uniref:quinone oxidoreductase PIG3-like n=1 Tax=Impatiens glandulifera TaxID=253017 RepID=UPI001FB1936A|nr:quinone oxidoreductase PIG3-like [Impatiens glandulifera]
MKAVVITSPGSPKVLQVQEVDEPQLQDGEVLIKIEATAINMVDTFQRKGLNRLRIGASPYLGLECSGTIEAVGTNVSRWKIGDQVCALLSGGGYAEKVTVPSVQLLPVPPNISLKDAAFFPKAAYTVWSTVFMISKLSPGQSFLVHGGSTGIGTFAIQIAKYYGIKVFTTAVSEEELAFCKDIGADVCINCKTEDFVVRVNEETQGKGVDVILDSIGEGYYKPNLESLNVSGRLFLSVGGKFLMFGYIGDTRPKTNLVTLLTKHVTIQLIDLHGKSIENKGEIVREVEKNVWPAIDCGKVKPVVYKSFPLSEASEAHSLMESSKHMGKILLFP